MGLGRKLFESTFAGAASQPILEQQQNQLQLLRERLQQIADRERQLAVQQLAGDQALNRQQLVGEQARDRQQLAGSQQLLRDSLSNIRAQEAAELQNQRVLGREAAVRGVDPTGQDADTLLSTIATTQQELIQAETSQKQAEAFQKLQSQALDLAENLPPGVEFSAMDAVLGRVPFDEVQRAVIGERVRQENLQEIVGGDPIISVGDIDRISQMTPEQAEAFLAQQFQNPDIHPTDRFRASLGVALAHRRVETEGVEGARDFVDDQIGLITKAMGGDFILSALAGGRITENRETIDSIKTMIQSQMVPGSDLDQTLQRVYGVGIEDVVPGGVITDDALRQAVLQEQQEQVERETEQVSQSFGVSQLETQQRVVDELVQPALAAIQEAEDPQAETVQTVQALLEIRAQLEVPPALRKIQGIPSQITPAVIDQAIQTLVSQVGGG